MFTLRRILRHALFGFCALGLIAGSSSHADIIITEVMYDTRGIEAGTHFGEWIELFNTGPDSVNLSGWFVEKDGTIDGLGVDPLTLVQGSPVLCPGQFALIVPDNGLVMNNAAAILDVWNIHSRLAVFQCPWTGAKNLSNTGETIALYAADMTLMDLAPYPDLGANEGSVQVYVSNLAVGTNDIAANWVQSNTTNSYECPDAQSFFGLDYAYFDINNNDEWDLDEPRDFGTPGRHPIGLTYAHAAPPTNFTADAIRAMVIGSVILPSPNADQLCAYDFEAPFPECSVLTAPDGDAPILTIPERTWVVWIDDDVLADFAHPARVVLIDDATGFMRVVNIGWWPEINGVQYFDSTDVRIDHPRNFWGNCSADAVGFSPGGSGEPLLPELFEFIDDIEATEDGIASGGAACAIAISGSKDPHFNKNVDMFLKGLQDKGLVTPGRSKAVKHPNSKKKDIDKALADLPADCGKLYVYIGTHGSNGSLSLPGGSISAKEFACKLADKKAREYCIVIQACQSGSIIAALKAKNISGTVTTSAPKGKSSYFLPGQYSYYTKYIVDCLKQNNIDSLKKAVEWAKEQMKKHRKKDPPPQCDVLTGKGLDLKNGAPPAKVKKGQPVNYQFQVEGDFIPPVQFFVEAPGILPPGLSLDPTTGHLFGTPLMNGQFEYVVRIQDCCTSDEVALPFVMEVTDEALPFLAPLTVLSEVPIGLTNMPYHFPLGISGGQPPYNVQIIHGNLPPGMQIIPAGPDVGTIVGGFSQEISVPLTLQVLSGSGPFQQVAIRNVVVNLMHAVPRPACPNDLNFSGDESLEDLATFVEFMTGPVAQDDIPAAAVLADLDGDQDIDLRDYAAFAIGYGNCALND